MAISVNTNASSLLALQALTRTTRELEATQLRITIGLRVTGPQVDASAFAIAQNLRGDVGGLTAVKLALANGESAVAVAVSAGQSVADLLIEIKAKVTQANQAGLDSASRSAIQADFVVLRDQIETIVLTADFNNVNLIASGATDLNVLSSVSGSNIAVTAQDLSSTSLGILNSSLATSASAALALTAIDSAVTLSSNRLASLGAAATRIEVQSDFTVSLIGTLEVGIGNLVDANLAEEAARLQALEIQQQLGVQGLAIANAAPSLVLQLFT